ncbi:MAG: winged helix-turn-helix domain-containing protein [Candidatus Korobacteraceae bacterium]
MPGTAEGGSTLDRSEDKYRLGAFEVDFRSGELRKSGLRIRIQGQPLQVLSILLRRPGRIVTREEFQNLLWPGGTFVDFDHGLNTAIKRLRDALDDNPERPRFIETLPRHGYRFIGPVDAFERRRMVQPSWRYKKMLAVLPLTNLSADPSHHSVAEGMTEELITQLGKSDPEELGVIAHTSVEQYSSTKKTVLVIGKELGVDYVLEGSLRSEGNRVRISLQLIQVSDQTHIWAEEYDATLDDVLGFESNVAAIVTPIIREKLNSQERRRNQLPAAPAVDRS